MERKRLSDILHNGQRDSIASAWDQTAAAEDFAVLPAGEYIAHINAGELFTSKTNNTPGYKLTFQICEGEHTGRRLWHDLWLTPAALPMTKRDLAKLGIVSLEQLEGPVSPGIRCKLKVSLRTDDDGTTYNQVKRFEVIGIDPADPFAPAEADENEDADPAEGDTTFDPEQLAAEGGAA